MLTVLLILVTALPNKRQSPKLLAYYCGRVPKEEQARHCGLGISEAPFWRSQCEMARIGNLGK